MAAQHEHGFPTFLVKLLEEEQRFFFQAKAALLVAMDDIEGVLAPVVVDVVAFESLREDLLVNVYVWRTEMDISRPLSACKEGRKSTHNW